ncbi:MAG: putative ABC transporter permease [Bacilli bacterium]
MKEKSKRIFFHLVWLFIIGCFLGFIFETIYYFIKNGIWINKQGLLYGPFKPIYGCGLVLITACLANFKKGKSPVWIFVGGVVIGTFFEYFASYFQEIVFGTYTWTYSSFNLNLNGRIYLPYCFMWGVISFIWMKYGYKLYLKCFNKLYSKKFEIVTYIVAVLMIINIILTSLVTYRFSERSVSAIASNKLEEKLDIYYPDDVVKKKFPKLRVYK